MGNNETDIGGPERAFPTTHWSSLLENLDSKQSGFQVHLENLVNRYWKPVYHYHRARRGSKVEDAKDLTQEFFTMLLQKDALKRFSPDRGSFRGFLKTALRNFEVSAHRARKVREPRDGAVLFAFENAEDAWEEAVRRRPEMSPEAAFDQEWSRAVIMDAMDRLKQQLESKGKGLYFELFRDYCLEQEAEASYATLAGRYRLSESDVRNHLRYARQVVREILRDRIQEYTTPGKSVEEELRFLLGP